MSNNSNLNKEKKDFRCKTCPREETYRIEVITRLIWEEHHHDFSKSILNPKLQYQALFLINKKDSTDNPITNIKRICFPKDWMLKGEDIIDIRINNSYCPFFNCVFQDEEDHLVVDLHNTPLSGGDSFYFIANIQDIWRTKVDAFSRFLDRFIIFNNELKNSDNQKNSENGSNNDEEKKKRLDRLQKKINTDYLEEAYTKKSLFKSKKYIFHYLIYCTPMEKIDLVDYWIKIPNICEIEESCVWDSNSEKTCKMIADEKYLSILNRKKLKKILQDEPKMEKIEEIQNSDLKKVKNDYQKKIKCLNIKSSEENLKEILKKNGSEEKFKENLKKNGYKEIGSLRYQSSEIDHQLYHLRVKNLTTSILIRNVLKFKKEIIRWYRLPLFLSGLQIILALIYLFFYDFIIYFLPEFNSWVFLTFSINILTLLLISLNWGTLQQLRLFEPKIYSKYLIYILASLTILIVAIIFQPFIREIYKFILGDI